MALPSKFNVRVFSFYYRYWGFRLQFIDALGLEGGGEEDGGGLGSRGGLGKHTVRLHIEVRIEELGVLNLGQHLFQTPVDLTVFLPQFVRLFSSRWNALKYK